MKTSNKQKAVIDTVLGTIQHWKDTNDIMSPSHYTLIEEDARSIADRYDMEYDDEKIIKLEDALSSLLDAIRKF